MTVGVTAELVGPLSGTLDPCCPALRNALSSFLTLCRLSAFCIFSPHPPPGSAMRYTGVLLIQSLCSSDTETGPLHQTGEDLVNVKEKCRGEGQVGRLLKPNESDVL